jgi:predicted dehydrogenase
VVTVAVKVPAHRELVLGALAAGKHIYCEWPLGRNLAETEELANGAEKAGVHVAIGLQTRRNRAALRTRDLIASGAIGRPLSARLYSGTVAFSPKITAADAYLEDEANGATLMSIHAGHAIDLAIAVLGPLNNLTALGTTQYPEIEIIDKGTRQARSIADHLLVQARVMDGAALSVEVAGGRAPKATPFRLEVTGESGNLLLNGGAPRGFQSGRLRITLNGEPQELDDGEAAGMPDTAANVAMLYASLRDDIQSGTSTAPGFHHAAQLTRLCDDQLSSSKSGSRKKNSNWPG